MPMVVRGSTGAERKFRLLLSGVSNTGKTWSIRSFEEKDRSLVVIVCPGEAGSASLPEESTDTFTSIEFEVPDESKVSTVEWSKDALNEFYMCYKEVVKNKPDKLFIEGVQHLYSHNFNVVTKGEWLAGKDLNVNESGVVVAYRAGNLYNMGHRTFGNWLGEFYTCPVPFVGVTVWEELQDEKDESDKPSGMRTTRYYHPALPGRMAINIAGRFDARLSCKVQSRCFHNCSKMKRSEPHHVWQFYPTSDTPGVGVKGLKVSEEMAKVPFIHQTYKALKAIMNQGGES